MTVVHVVDDDPAVLRLIGEALLRRGYSVSMFATPEEYLANVKGRPDLLVTDLLMPGIDGVGFCEALRSDEAMRSVPIMVVTGLVVRDGARSDEQLRERFGVRTIVTKPFALAHLFESVERILGPLQAPSETVAARPEVRIAPEAAAKMTKSALAVIPLRQVTVAPTEGSRVEPRYEASFEVTFPTQDALLSEYTENISRGGVFVHTLHPPPLGSEVQLELRVPWEPLPLQLTATVAHVAEPGLGGTAGFGCRIAHQDRAALGRWFNVVRYVAEQQAPRTQGPRVYLLGFSGERVGDLMRQAGVLCRSDLRIIPLASWRSVLREAERVENIRKLLIVDVGNSQAEEARATLFDARMVRDFANIPNVALAYVGLSKEDEVNLPTDLHVIKAGALTNADLVGAVVTWLGLPERTHVRVAATGMATLAQGEREVMGDLMDVSLGGARFLIQGVVHPAEPVAVSFALGSHGNVERLVGVLRWAKPEGRGRSMCGVTFGPELGAARAVIAAYVEEQSRYLQSLEGLRRRDT